MTAWMLCLDDALMCMHALRCLIGLTVLSTVLWLLYRSTLAHCLQACCYAADTQLLRDKQCVWSVQAGDDSSDDDDESSSEGGRSRHSGSSDDDG